MGSTSVEQFPVQTRLPWAGERRDQPKCLGGTVWSVICIHTAGRRNIFFVVLARHLNAPRRGNLNGDGGYQGGAARVDTWFADPLRLFFRSRRGALFELGLVSAFARSCTADPTVQRGLAHTLTAAGRFCLAQ